MNVPIDLLILCLHVYTYATVYVIVFACWDIVHTRQGGEYNWWRPYYDCYVEKKKTRLVSTYYQQHKLKEVSQLWKSMAELTPDIVEE